MPEYDSPGSCNACGGPNECKTEYTMDGPGTMPAEISTKCNACGFEDYWAYGYFESGQAGYNASRKYSFTTEEGK